MTWEAPAPSAAISRVSHLYSLLETSQQGWGKEGAKSPATHYSSTPSTLAPPVRNTYRMLPLLLKRPPPARERGPCCNPQAWERGMKNSSRSRGEVGEDWWGDVHGFRKRENPWRLWEGRIIKTKMNYLHHLCSYQNYRQKKNDLRFFQIIWMWLNWLF